MQSNIKNDPWKSILYENLQILGVEIIYNNILEIFVIIQNPTAKFINIGSFLKKNLNSL